MDHCKTDAGDRYIPLNEKALELLERVKEYNLEAGFPCEDDNFIFYRKRKGETLEVNVRIFDGRLEDYCRDSGFARKSMHNIRRTFATEIYYNNVEKDKGILEKLRILMGHSTVSQTWAYIIKDKRDTDFSLVENL